MLVSPIYKKGDKLDPANYQAIALLSIPGKVFLRVLINQNRGKDELQYGFRPGRGIVDAIFMRQIIGKARKKRLIYNLVS